MPISESYWVPRVGNGKKSTSARSAVGHLLGREGAQEVHRGLVVGPRLGGFLPGPAERVGLGVRQELRPLLEDRLDLGIGPLLLAGQEVGVELIAVHAHVQDVERAHGRPAVLVGEGERDEAVGLDLLGQRDELVPRLRDGVALLPRRSSSGRGRPTGRRRSAPRTSCRRHPGRPWPCRPCSSRRSSARRLIFYFMINRKRHADFR